jgi:ATP phosphoribosyltransferase
MLLKHRDIPKLVDSGDLDFGITGSEWLAELNSAAHIIGELDWCDARISLIGVPGASVKNIGQAPSVCATEFPNITRRYLGEAGVPHVKVKAVSGSCEAFIPTVCGFGVDCVESGETLRANQLVEIEPILTSRVVLISRVPLSHLDQGKIEQLKELTGDIRWLD